MNGKRASSLAQDFKSQMKALRRNEEEGQRDEYENQLNRN